MTRLEFPRVCGRSLPTNLMRKSQISHFCAKILVDDWITDVQHKCAVSFVGRTGQFNTVERLQEVNFIKVFVLSCGTSDTCGVATKINMTARKRA